jgi:hypothetical protein
MMSAACVRARHERGRQSASKVGVSLFYCGTEGLVGPATLKHDCVSRDFSRTDQLPGGAHPIRVHARVGQNLPSKQIEDFRKVFNLFCKAQQQQQKSHRERMNS